MAPIDYINTQMQLWCNSEAATLILEINSLMWKSLQKYLYRDRSDLRPSCASETNSTWADLCALIVQVD